MTPKAWPAAGRTRELVKYDDVMIEVITEGRGQPLVLLPSSGRDSEDFDEVAAGLASSDFNVLRPQPRGIGQSTGPMTGITFHDFSKDIARVIESRHNGAAIVVGHAFGNWIARATATDYPHLVQGTVLAAAAAKQFPDGLSEALAIYSDQTRPDDERIEALKFAFFAPEHDPRIWLTGWHPATMQSQRQANQNTNPNDWRAGGTAPMFDLQAGSDPWRPAETRNELKDEFGARVSVALIADASHALIPEQPREVVNQIVAWVGSIR